MTTAAAIDTATLAAYEIDGLLPERTIAAASVDDVVLALREANAATKAVVLWGGGTRIRIGDPPERYDVALDLRGLHGVVEYEPADLTVTVRAGTTLDELRAILEPHGQRWPVEVGHPERATVGGTIASAADGPARLAYFHPRDWVIGARAVLGDGTLTKAGGRVVKNVTGYDLARFYSGSYGTLCALVQLTLKLTALAERDLTLRVDLPNPSYAYIRVRELLAEGLPLDAVALVLGRAAEQLGSPTRTALFLRVAGPAEAVERLGSTLRERLPCEEVGSDIWTRIAAFADDEPTSIRATWPPGRRLDVFPGSAVLYPGVDVLHLFDEQTAEDLRAFRMLAEPRGGAVVIERGPIELKRAVGAWGTPRAPSRIARSLKDRFDPRGVLAPGRLPL